MDKLGGHEAASSVPSQAARHPKYITYSRLLLFLVSGDSCPIRGCSHGFQAEPCWYIVPRRKLVRTGTKIHRPHIYSNLCSAACSAKEKFNRDKDSLNCQWRHYHSISARFIYHWLTTQLNYTSCYISLYAHHLSVSSLLSSSPSCTSCVETGHCECPDQNSTHRRRCGAVIITPRRPTSADAASSCCLRPTLQSTARVVEVSH